MFRARLDLFQHFVLTGQLSAAEQMWWLLDPMGRDWPRHLYRAGLAESAYAELQFMLGSLTEHDLREAEDLAAGGRNRPAIRQLHHLRGQWLHEQGHWTEAAESFAAAVRLAREAGIVDTDAETWLALTRLHLGDLSDPLRRADDLAHGRRLAHLPLGLLFQALGEPERAAERALAAYRFAWADGEPYVQRHALQQATDLLVSLGVDGPDLAPYDPTARPPPSWAPLVEEAINRLRPT